MSTQFSVLNYRDSACKSGLGPGSWVLGPGSWDLGSGFRVLGFGFLVSGCGFQVVGFRLWVSGPNSGSGCQVLIILCIFPAKSAFLELKKKKIMNFSLILFKNLNDFENKSLIWMKEEYD